MQPFVLCLVLGLHTHDEFASTTTLINPRRLWCATRAAEHIGALNTSLNETLVDAQCTDRAFDPYRTLAVSAVRVDCLFFLMPFAVSSSVSTLLWTHLSNDNVLHEGVAWDEQLDPACVWYELAYCAELMCTVLAYTGMLADGATDVEIYFSVIAAGGTLSLVAGSARFNRAQETEAIFALLLLGLCALVFGALFTRVLAVSCTLAFAIALTFAMHVIIVAMVHVTARGERAASTIIAFRTLPSLIGGYILIATYAVGKDTQCTVTST